MQPKVSARGPVAGAVEDSALWKAVALSAANAFTGALAVHDGERAGTIWLREGRLVHAEAGALEGEPAFRDIVLWAGAGYTVAPDSTPPRETIARTLAVLLVELRGHEVGVAPTPAPVPSRAPAPGAPGRAEWLVAATQRIRRVPGVIGAALLGTDGTPAPGLAPETPMDRAAAALAPASRRLGEALGLGRPVLGVGRGAERLVLLIAARDHQLIVLLRADDQVEAAQARIRALLNPQQPA
jgi:predicted regulator of Ras-like GTPase activity (Roadblock/LC7/MglB family)